MLTHRGRLVCGAAPAFGRRLLVSSSRRIFDSSSYTVARHFAHRASGPTISAIVHRRSRLSPSSPHFTFGSQKRDHTVASNNDTTSTTSQSSPQTPPKKRSLLASFFLTTSLVVAFTTAGFIMSAAQSANVVNGFLNAPTDAETLTLFTPPTPTATEVNEHIVNHPLAIRLRKTPGITESRPAMKIPEAMRPNNFTGGTLLGAGMLEAPLLQFNDYEAELPTMTQIMYFGQGLCGHPGIVHGGMLATMLDEGLARACFSKLPNKFGVTATLKIDYRIPCPADRYVILKAETVKVDGRKVWAKGWIELLNDDGVETGIKVVEAEALYIEPKGASTVGKIYSNGH
ncbi:Hypothetical protein R9X50_00250100 [Acrodontium crateriforme]|uniref:Thioesterase domain-containing protein n=1 Tax=Acrodontium crateriforme TaxID=150365 RepID=A0AAQ3RB20_9PEZI|nr:Hypothetical protein R9X50_00250100 [Acrodontium crateriforme]